MKSALITSSDNWLTINTVSYLRGSITPIEPVTYKDGQEGVKISSSINPLVIAVEGTTIDGVEVGSQLELVNFLKEFASYDGSNNGGGIDTGDIYGGLVKRKKIDILASDFRALASSPIQLLPDLTDGSFYSIEYIACAVTSGSASYNYEGSGGGTEEEEIKGHIELHHGGIMINEIILTDPDYVPITSFPKFMVLMVGGTRIQGFIEGLSDGLFLKVGNYYWSDMPDDITFSDSEVGDISVSIIVEYNIFTP